MMRIQKSVLVSHSAARMFDLVADVPSYPQFMPWCAGARAQEMPDGRIRASIEIRIAGVHSGFTTLNRNRAGESIQMQLEEGPFTSLAGLWRFMELGADGSKVEFDLRYAFSAGAIGRVIAPVFDVVATSMIEAFSVRAESLYG